LLEAAEMDPTVINGGIINAWGSNAKLGDGDWMVCEADESDGTFLKLPAAVAIVTNIDPEHLDHYGSFDELRNAFDSFVENIPFYGFAALCIDHPEVQALIPRVSDRRIVTYGFSPQADVRAENISSDREGNTFDVVISDRKTGEQRRIDQLKLAMHGKHNIQNSLTTVVIANEMGLDDDVVRRALGGFRGVKRRFTQTGVVNDVTIIDDYGHHPVEISAVLDAAREVTDSRVIAVVQPHRYTRLRDLFEDFCSCFNAADAVIVADVFAAGEDPIEGVDKDAMVAGLQQRGHRTVVPLAGPEDLASLVKDMTEPGDMVVCLGAGSISQWANALPGQFEALCSPRVEAANDGS
jgi:UDP-N-acetylmuramate--alanine ligase